MGRASKRPNLSTDLPRGIWVLDGHKSWYLQCETLAGKGRSLVEQGQPLPSCAEVQGEACPDEDQKGSGG